MSLPHRELVELIDEAATRLEPTEYGPWLGQQTVTVAGDPTVPNAPTITASPADQAIDLAITPPSTNTNGSQYLDHKEFEIFYSTSPGIDVDNPTTYAGSFTTSSTQHTFPASVTYYFRAVARDKYGNRSDPSSEVSATPIAAGQPVSVDDYTNNIANVYIGVGIIGIEFQPPKPTWSRWAGWKLYYDVDDGTGWTGTWTLIYTGTGPGFLHKGLNESYAYKYKLTVLGEDGTETTGTVSDNAGAGYTPNASDNSAILGSTIFAERMVATKEMISRTFIGGVLQSTNWSDTAGSQLDLDNGTLKLGGSSSPKFQVDADGVLHATGAVISGALTAGPGSSIDGVYIEDATITDAKIASLSADKITTGTLDASVVNVINLNADNITTGKLNGYYIETNSILADRLNVSQLSAISADLGEVTAGTVTSVLFRTAASGMRAEINPSGTYPHSFSCFDSDGHIRTQMTLTSFRVADPSENVVTWVGSQEEGGMYNGHIILGGDYASIVPQGSGEGYVGTADIYWYEVNAKYFTDRGCLGDFSHGVELRDGRRVSDLEALKAIKAHPERKTEYGTPMLDYSTLPKAVYRPAGRGKIKRTERATPSGWKVSEEIIEEEGAEGAELTALISIMIGAIKELDERLSVLEKGNHGLQ